MTDGSSCPVTCGLYNKCYAHAGHTALNWRKVPERGTGIEGILDAFAGIGRRGIVRHNVAGDLPQQNGTICRASTLALALAAKAPTIWTYTHHALTKANLTTIRLAIQRGFVVNASTDSMAEADKVLDKFPDIPVVTILPSGTGKNAMTPGGRRVVTCPAELRDEVTCSSCGGGKPLCARPQRDYVIGFLPKNHNKTTINAHAKEGS